MLTESGRPSLKQEGWFWTQRQQLFTDFGTFWTLKPEAHLLYLCAHTVLQHGAANFYLQRYFDIHMLLGSTELDWQLLIDQAMTLRWTYAVEVALSDCLRWLGTDVPAGTLTNLAEHRPPDEDIGKVVRQRKPGALWESELRKLKMLLPRQRARMIWASLFPAADYMRRRYGLDTVRAVWPYYLYRWGRLLSGTARGIWNRLVWWLARR